MAKPRKNRRKRTRFVPKIVLTVTVASTVPILDADCGPNVIALADAGFSDAGVIALADSGFSYVDSGNEDGGGDSGAGHG